MRKLIAITALAVIGFTGCTSKNDDGAITPKENPGATKYQDNAGNESKVGGYTRADAANAWRALSADERANGCDMWAGFPTTAAFVADLVSVGYAAADARVTDSYMYEVC
jgi:hypothetical protein